MEGRYASVASPARILDILIGIAAFQTCPGSGVHATEDGSTEKKQGINIPIIHNFLGLSLTV